MFQIESPARVQAPWTFKVDSRWEQADNSQYCQTKTSRFRNQYLYQSLVIDYSSALNVINSVDSILSLFPNQSRFPSALGVLWGLLRKIPRNLPDLLSFDSSDVYCILAFLNLFWIFIGGLLNFAAWWCLVASLHPSSNFIILGQIGSSDASDVYQQFPNLTHFFHRRTLNFAAWRCLVASKLHPSSNLIVHILGQIRFVSSQI